MAEKLPGTAIVANTITTTQLSTIVVNQISAGGGPRVSSLIYPGNDTAGNTVGGQTVYINGAGFETNNAIYINGNAVPEQSHLHQAIQQPIHLVLSQPMHRIKILQDNLLLQHQQAKVCCLRIMFY